MKRISARSQKKKNTKRIIALCAGYAVLIAAVVFLLINRTSAQERRRGADIPGYDVISDDVETSDPVENEGSEDTDPSTSETSDTPQASTVPETTSPADLYSNDKTPPVISGVTDLTVHEGDTVSYKSGITVTDDQDPDPSLTVDVSRVDMSRVGNYIVIYIAEDAAGNASYDAANIRVAPRESVTSEQAFEVADEILASVLTDDMTPQRKVYEIYWYLHRIGYTDVHYGEAVNYLDNAYYFLTTRQGDCRCFYAASRLLLERAGFMTMMVKSSEDAPIIHYWNLVSIDEGKTWYHYDPTCWNWGEDGDICMVTDQWLLDFARDHDYSPLVWVLEDYPPTPDEDFDFGF